MESCWNQLDQRGVCNVLLMSERRVTKRRYDEAPYLQYMYWSTNIQGKNLTRLKCNKNPILASAYTLFIGRLSFDKTFLQFLNDT